MAAPAPPGGAAPPVDPDPDPMFGQFLVEPEDEDPVELVGGAGLVDPDELLVGALPDAVPVVPEPELVLVVVEPALVAALAASAPPATRPLVKAPMASALRKRSFMVCPFSLIGSGCHPRG
jgi:hypothetical protein